MQSSKLAEGIISKKDLTRLSHDKSILYFHSLPRVFMSYSSRCRKHSLFLTNAYFFRVILIIRLRFPETGLTKCSHNRNIITRVCSRKLMRFQFSARVTGVSSNGRTAVSGTVCEGSTPSTPAILQSGGKAVARFVEIGS